MARSRGVDTVTPFGIVVHANGAYVNSLSRWRANFGIILAVPLKEESAGAAGAAAGEEAQGGSIVRELNRASSYFV